ncbi:TPA: hypothetical protein ACKQDF_000956 [Stenotrophomonas maltophilia]
MTNDNKTLADVRPGGRVRLGDQLLIDKRARELLAAEYRQAGYPCESEKIIEGYWDSHPSIRAIIAALSAQPSPGGQGALSAMLPDDARLVGVIADNIERGKLDHPGFYRNTQLAEALRRVLDTARSGQRFPCGQGDIRSEKAATFLRQYLTYLRSSPRQGLRPRWCDVYEAIEVAIEALTARQPSKQPDSVALGEATEFCIEKGGRQLVGESVWVEVRREGDRTFPRAMTWDQADAFLRSCNVGPLPTIHPLYAAPPAQHAEVSEGSFRAAASRQTASAESNATAEALIAAARQPVGEPVSEAIEQLADDVDSCVADACGYLASDSGWDDYGIYRDDAVERYRALPDRIRALATPPAPAVDLGQFRQPVQDWLDDAQASMEEHGDYDGVFGHAIEEGTRLLALIDGKAVQS